MITPTSSVLGLSTSPLTPEHSYSAEPSSVQLSTPKFKTFEVP